MLLICQVFSLTVYFQSERRLSVSATESKLRPPPPAPVFSPSSVLGPPSVSMSLSVTNTEPTSPRSATPASDSAGVWTPTARRSPTPGLDLAAPLCVSQLTLNQGNSSYDLFHCLSFQQGREGYFGNVIGYRLLVTLFKM